MKTLREYCIYRVEKGCLHEQPCMIELDDVRKWLMQKRQEITLNGYTFGKLDELIRYNCKLKQIDELLEELKQ